jgi:sec-independent protein translocase protein TatA
VSNLDAVLRKERQVITGMLAEILGADGLIVIAVVVIVLLFGGTKLPKLARGLGSASHEFKKGMEEGDAEKGDPAASKGEDKTSGPIHPA